MTNIPEEQTFFGHQKALFILFFLQKCRTIYGMKALLIFILQNTIYFLMILEFVIGSYAA
jgi:dipeptide/tripeptide permease